MGSHLELHQHRLIKFGYFSRNLRWYLAFFCIRYFQRKVTPQAECNGLAFKLLRGESEVTLSCVTLCDPMGPYQAPLSMGFSRQEYWNGLPFPSPRDLPDPGIKPRSPALQADALPSEPPGKPMPLSPPQTPATVHHLLPFVDFEQ